MNNKDHSDIKHFTRGGQITLHNIRMFIQIMDKITLLAIAVFMVVTIFSAWVAITDYEGYVVGEYLWASILPLFNGNRETIFIQPNGVKSFVGYADITHAVLVKEIIRQVSLKLIRALILGVLLSLATLFGVSKWLKKRGKSHTDHTQIKGDEFSSREATAQRIIDNQIKSDLTLAGLPLIRDSETMHFLVHGTTRSGKSNAIKELLEQIRRRGDRAIIYDRGCNYLEEFYQPDYDVLLNPLDVRGRRTHLWLDCRDAADFDNNAASQIPMPLSTQDPFWINAARTIFSAAAYEMRNDSERHELKLLRYLLTADLNCLQQYLKGTEAETLVSEKIEKTAVSIKSVLATYLKSLKYIKTEGEPFSIRQWIQDDKAHHWLFITSLADRHETLKPLITSWMDTGVNALLSLPANQKSRIWVILDELYSLHQLPSLRSFLSEAGKFGGCGVLGLQSYSQLAEVYGHEGACIVSSLLNTRIMFRQPDPKMARWTAENFGEAIVQEVNEGQSYGANSIRDGISINRTETRKPLVSYSEIMSLSNLQAYIRLPGKYPITPIHFSYKNRPKINEGIILRHIDSAPVKEIDEVIDRCTKNHEGLKVKPENSPPSLNASKATLEQALDL